MSSSAEGFDRSGSSVVFLPYQWNLARAASAAATNKASPAAVSKIDRATKSRLRLLFIFKRISVDFDFELELSAKDRLLTFVSSAQPGGRAEAIPPEAFRSKDAVKARLEEFQLRTEEAEDELTLDADGTIRFQTWEARMFAFKLDHDILSVADLAVAPICPTLTSAWLKLGFVGLILAD